MIDNYSMLIKMQDDDLNYLLIWSSDEFAQYTKKKNILSEAAFSSVKAVVSSSSTTEAVIEAGNSYII